MRGLSGTNGWHLRWHADAVYDHSNFPKNVDRADRCKSALIRLMEGSRVGFEDSNLAASCQLLLLYADLLEGSTFTFSTSIYICRRSSVPFNLGNKGTR